MHAGVIHLIQNGTRRRLRYTAAQLAWGLRSRGELGDWRIITAGVVGVNLGVGDRQSAIRDELIA